MKQFILEYLEKSGTIIRKNILLYLIFINIYKKFSYLFPVEKQKYLFLSNNKKFKKVIDIGCNKFQTAKTLLKINSKLRIDCYDPSPLIKHTDVNKSIKFFNFALHSKNIKKELIIPKYFFFYLDSLASFDISNINLYLKKNNICKKKIIFETFLVQMKKFKKINKIDFIKIDVEGSELKVLKTLNSTINKFKPILLVETSMNKKIKNFLRKKNYFSYSYNSQKNFFCEDKFKSNVLVCKDFYFLHKSEDRVNFE